RGRRGQGRQDPDRDRRPDARDHLRSVLTSRTECPRGQAVRPGPVPAGSGPHAPGLRARPGAWSCQPRHATMSPAQRQSSCAPGPAPHAPSRAGRTSRGRGSVPGPTIIGEAAGGPGAADLGRGRGGGEPSGLPGLEDRLAAPLRATGPRTPAPALGRHRQRRRSLPPSVHLPRARAAALLLPGHRTVCPAGPDRTVRPAATPGPSALWAPWEAGASMWLPVRANTVSPVPARTRLDRIQSLTYGGGSP